MTECRHCGEAVPERRARLEPVAAGYCCSGCQAAAALSSGNELGFRDYDSPEVLDSIARPTAEGIYEADVLVDGIRCGACATDIERRLRGLPGLQHINVNTQSRIVTLRWNASRVTFGHILETIAEGGYTPRPLPLDTGLDDLRRDDRRAIRRLGLAGLGAMQVMMLSLGLYLGDDYGLTGDVRRLLMWAAMLLATPVVLYSGQPFFAGALTDLRHRRFGMDVPVALAIGAAYGMSVTNTFTGQGEIWFDSACMFVFFLSLGRHMEAAGRRRAQQGLRALVASQPNAVTVISADGACSLPAERLQVGMRLLIRPGETFPADGTVLKGESRVDESLLTGESTPHQRDAGSKVLAGSINLDQALEIRADKVGADTTRACLMRLLRRAELRKPAVAQLADRVAGHFVLGVLAIASLTALAWAHIEPSRAFEITLAVLVVTCPCALSLATPASLSAAAAALARKGMLVTRPHTLEALGNITDVVFDKTGTLTEDRLEVAEIRTSECWQREHIIALAAGMERNQTHPIATALRDFAEAQVPDLETCWQAGRGVSTELYGHRYELGSPVMLLDDPTQTPHDGLTWLVLTENGQPIGWIGLRTRIRPEADRAIKALRDTGVTVHLMSGDNAAAVQHVANTLGIENTQAGMLPDHKLAAVQRMHREGARVLMVGDGLNDAPVLAGADVSVAMQAGAALAQASADAVLLSGNLLAVPMARRLALQTRRILYQNISWAIGYNLLAVPLAVTGMLAPWMAAIGMSLSSMLVVGNALRLLRDKTSFRLHQSYERLEESQGMRSLHSPPALHGVDRDDTGTQGAHA